MNNKHRLSLFAYALILAYPALGANQFTPFPPTPLNLQPKPADMVQPNVLVFLDNSFDGARSADGNNYVWVAGTRAQDQLWNKETKLDVAKEVLGNVASAYPRYRWGVASYTPTDVDIKKYLDNGLCFEDATDSNYATEGCTFVTNFSGGNIIHQLYANEAGSTIYIPIKSRNKEEMKSFVDAVKVIPMWGDTWGDKGLKSSAVHIMPITSAYYELTRYYRGLTSAYKRGEMKINDTGKFTLKDKDGKTETKSISISNNDAFSGNTEQYISPIQYRCQSNNIIFMTSAGEVRLTTAAKGKRAFYQPYFLDPLYRHDNPKYSYSSEGYKKNKLPVQFLKVSDRKLAVATTLGGDKEIAYKKKYTEIYDPRGKYTVYVPNSRWWYYLDELKAKDKARINPYMDIIEDWSEDRVKSATRGGIYRGIYKKSSENKLEEKLTTAQKNIYSRNAYNEYTGLESFAHLAYAGDIIAKKNEYQGDIDGLGISLGECSTGSSDDKCLYYTNKEGKTKASSKDAEKKAWDGTDDKAVKGSDGDTSDYSRRFGKQNIHTYTIGFGVYSDNPKVEDYKAYKIYSYGLPTSPLVTYMEGIKEFQPGLGYVVFYNGRPVFDEDDKFVTVTVTGALGFKGSTRYITTSASLRDLNLPVGGELRFIPEKKAREIISPKVRADEMLKRAANKGGGAYFSVNTSSRDALEKALVNILSLIDASLISLPVGSALGSNDAKISTAITPTLNTDRWLSQLRFYNLQPDGVFKEKNFQLPDYTQPSTTLISTPDGVRELSEKGDLNNVTLNNEAFNIGNPDNLPTGSKVDHNGKHGLLVANSSRTEEWQSLVKWLLQSTNNDRDDVFKFDIFGVKDLRYRDRAPNKDETAKRGHVLGDILDSNIVTFGGEESPVTGKSGKEKYKTGDNHPYLAVGANDGMLHIFQSNEKDAQTEHPYFHKFAYIPGTAKRTSENDTIMRNLVYTAEQNYGTQSNPHQYFVNGEIFYRKTDSGLVGQSDQGQMMLVGSLGQGGRAAYSLNIGGERYGSQSAEKVGLEATGDVVDNVPLWDTSTDQFGKAKAGVDENMGYPIGSPQVGRVSLKNIKGATQFSNDADVRYATFLNSGVDSGKNPTLFVLDQLGGVNAAPKEYGNADQNQGKAGELIKAIEAGTEVGGLAAPLFVDYNRDGITDFVYAGDSNGNMWRFELRGGKDSWKAVKIYHGSRTKQVKDKHTGNGTNDEFKTKPHTVAVNKVTVGGIELKLERDYTIEDSGTEDEKVIKLKTAPATGKEIKIDYTTFHGNKPLRPITTAPDIYYDGKGSKIHVFFGTGSVLYQKDFTDKNEQAMFGIVDDFSCLDEDGKGACAAEIQEKMYAEEPDKKLTERVLDKKTGDVKVGSQKVSDTYRSVKDLGTTPMSENGWYVPLNVDSNAENGSERVVVRPLVIADQYQNSGTVFFTTRIFQDIHATNGDVSCTPPPVEVESWVMGLDVQTGGNPRKVRLGTIASSKDSVAGYLVNGQASAFLRTDSGVEINQHGAGTSGIAVPLANPNQSVVKMVRACKVDGKANTAISVQNPDGSSTITRFELDCGKPLSRRLSWREIF